MTAHLVGQDRSKWGLYVKRIGQHEVHPICKGNKEGTRKSEELIAHMLDEAPNIVEEARSECKEENAKKPRR